MTSEGHPYYLYPDRQDPHYLARSTMIAALSQLAPTLARGRMVDLGSGLARGYEAIFKPYVTEYLCADRQYADRVDICADCCNLPLPDCSIDTILSTQVLEHVENPPLLIQEAYRLLKPGGTLILTAPMVWGLHEEPADFYRYTEHGLRYLLQQAGYGEIQIQPLEGPWAVVFQMVMDEYHLVWTRKSPYWSRRLIGGLNRLALWLDRKFPSRRLCLTYVATARRPLLPPS
jgi:SAM-dependent methyltransferase